MYPKVIDSDNFNRESFEDYYRRWPNTLSNIPRCIVENWIHRHWDDFQDWIPLNPHMWTYELRTFTNDEILSISHIYDWVENLHAEGHEYVTGARRSESWLAQNMLNNGTTPVPIIVGENFENIQHPKAPQRCLMKVPLQLIEGHSRLGCLFGMIDSSHPNLRTTHQVWVAKNT